MRIRHGFETCGHAVADDGHGRLHDLKLFLEAVDALDDRVEACTRGAKRAVAAVAQITHGEFLTRKFSAHLGFDLTVIIFALNQHVADEQDAVTVVECKFRSGLKRRKNGDTRKNP